MSVILALVTTIALIDGAAAAAPTDRCDVPESFLSSESELSNVTNEVKARQRLDISVSAPAPRRWRVSTASTMPIRRGWSRRCSSN